MFENYVFTEKAVWARSLDNKAAIETGRIFAEIFTLGLGAIARATAGHSDHWAFVAKGHHKDHPDRTAYYVSQFGEGNIIPRVWNAGTAVQFHGVMLRNLEDAKLALCTIEENINVWEEKVWKPCAASRTLLELETQIRSTPCSDSNYSVLANNCQHFANHLYGSV